MRRPILPYAAAVAALGAATLAAAAASPRQHRPVVVELYTAQGCAGCPEADRLLSELGSRKGVIALTLPVDYWDYLGWADTSAQPGFTKRQRAYADRLKVREIYTPEVIVDGRKEAGGANLDKDSLDTLLQQGAQELNDGPQVRWRDGDARVQVTPGRAGTPRADVWLMRFDPLEQSVRIKAGENKGKLVTQRYVVRELVRLGGYAGGVRRYVVPKATADGLSGVVLVQGVRGGRVYGAGLD